MSDIGEHEQWRMAFVSLDFFEEFSQDDKSRRERTERNPKYTLLRQI